MGPINYAPNPCGEMFGRSDEHRSRVYRCIASVKYTITGGRSRVVLEAFF